MKSQIIRSLYIILLILTQSACGSTLWTFNAENHKSGKISKSQGNFLSSGQITLSFPLRTETEYSLNPAKTDNFDKKPLPEKAPSPRLEFAPVIGFFPPAASFNPADNEIWIEIDSASKTLQVYKGREQIKSVKAEGEISLAPGEYPLQHKQKNPLWYAPDEYFQKRHLKVPPRGDNFRYRRGALGSYALYPTTTFPIHSGPFWSEETGGLKVSESELASIFQMVKPGTPVLIK
jgi:lipoprotein-anchoring transpeptidase ErfK/SrfK